MALEPFEREISWILREKYRGKMTPQALLDIQRLKQGEHVDYIIGFVEFLGCKIDLSKKPMIPRPETEYWVEKAIQDLKKREGKIRCLDLFAGSGCIGIAILKHIPGSFVDFGEKEKRFVQQIRISIDLNRISKKRYRIVQSDIFRNLRGSYDVIFANPPYVPSLNIEHVQASVLEQEPLGAIFGGKDGLEYIKPFLKEAVEHLKSNGRIYLEFDSRQKEEIKKLLKKNGYDSVQFFRDQYKKWRYLVVSH